MSPSAFIPFCDIGNNMSAMGMTIPRFEYPVCNKFRPKIRKGQLCYQVDVNDLDVDDKHEVLGLAFIMDYNSEKMIDMISRDVSDNVTGLHDMNDEDEKAVEAMIYIETLG